MDDANADATADAWADLFERAASRERTESDVTAALRRIRDERA